jgi:hypothetical protein
MARSSLLLWIERSQERSFDQPRSRFGMVLN